MSVIKCHGGKHYLHDWIISQFPPRCENPNAPKSKDPGWVHYVEPYFGSGAVMFGLDPEAGISLVANDIYRGLTNFWEVLQHESLFKQFVRRITATPCSRAEYQKACQAKSHSCETSSRKCVSCAVSFFIRNRQSRQATEKSFATLVKNRTRRGMNELASAWLSAVDGLPEAHRQLSRVVILNQDACECIRQQDGKRTFFYLDPPYLKATRTAKEVYKHEMTYQQHEELLDTLANVQGRFALSGYRSKLYNKYAKRHGWQRAEQAIDNKSSSKTTKEQKVECLWMNY